ncbi:trypsin-like serine protease, putative [Hepatocystis sp. ex Piliocolobus tephrosceles]|nr:trypsin-like serine protease, putative [Hepatocystis sp. ex Piliocolobus tephrosceles]
MDSVDHFSEQKKKNYKILNLVYYQKFIIEPFFFYLKQSITLVVYSFINFYLFLINIFYYVSKSINKKCIEMSNQNLVSCSPPLDNLYNSFVTIYTIHKKNNILEHTFKIQNLKFLGSGFIYDKKGYILTAAHNITSLDDIFVAKNCDKFYLANVTGLHKESDVCVMKINSKEPFSHISLDSINEDLKQGETVIAYGQIQDFDKETYSIGIVNQPKQSFTQFTNFNDEQQTCLYPFIQISNPINKGMSGSPVIDKHDNLVGMLQKKIDNFGLALPAHILKNITSHLQHKGKYEEPFLGLILKEKEYAIKNYKRVNKGLNIHEVIVGSPAEIGGLKKEDIILNINNRNIGNICDIHEILNSSCNRCVNFEIIRDNKKLKIKVKLW